MSPRWPIPLVAFVLLAAAASGAAQAATAVRLRTTGDLPFTSDELEQAVGARFAMSAAASAALVTVGPVDEAGVQVRMGERETVVSIGAHSGLAAARVVALAIAEIAEEGLDGASDGAPAAPSESAPPTVVAPPPTGPPAIATPALPPGATPPPEAPVRLSIALGTAKGTETFEPFIWTCEAAVAFPRRGFDLVAGLGVWGVPTINAGRPDEVSFMAGVVRAGAGWRVGPVQVVLGPFVAPYRLEGPLVSHTGLLAGGSVMARAGWRLFAGSNVEVFGSLRGDAFANRVGFAAYNSDPSFATPRVAASLAIGIGWDLGI